MDAGRSGEPPNRNIIMRALAEGRNVELRNFGVLEVQRRKSRIGRNPNKPETDVPIPERAVRYRTPAVRQRTLGTAQDGRLQLLGYWYAA